MVSSSNLHLAIAGVLAERKRLMPAELSLLRSERHEDRRRKRVDEGFPKERRLRRNDGRAEASKVTEVTTEVM